MMTALFNTLLVILHALYSLSSVNCSYVEWNSTDNKCAPDVCHGSNLLEIAGYNHQMPVSLINSTTLYDTNKTRACLKDKYIVILGDSSMAETTHDIIFLLSRMLVHDDIFHRYLAKCVGHLTPPYDNSNVFNIPNDSIFSVELDRRSGHRNLTFTLPDYNIHIRYRANGGNKLADNAHGIPGMLIGSALNEYLCLLGDPATACPKPDIVLIKSGHHDTGHIPQSIHAMSKLFNILNHTKTRYSKIYWLETTDYSSHNRGLTDLNTAAKRYCMDYDIHYIPTDNIAKIYNNTLYNETLTKDVFKSSTAHIGAIRYKGKESLVLTSYMTQNLLQHICA